MLIVGLSVLAALICCAFWRELLAVAVVVVLVAVFVGILTLVELGQRGLGS